MDRHDGIALGVVGAIVLIGLGAWWTLAPTDPNEPTEPAEAVAPAPQPNKPLTAPRTWSLPRPASAVQELDPVAGQEPHVPASDPEPVRAAPPGSMTREETQAFQRASMAVTKEANDSCLRPWTERTGSVAEAVMDVVVQDGVVVDVQLRSLTDLPTNVLDCIADLAWSQEWPVAVSEGEVRFQNSLAVGRRN